MPVHSTSTDVKVLLEIVIATGPLFCLQTWILYDQNFNFPSRFHVCLPICGFERCLSPVKMYSFLLVFAV